MPYAKNLHRQGEIGLDKVSEMERFSYQLTKGKDMGTAFVTEGYEGYDAYCIIPNTPAFKEDEGYVLYDEDLNKPVFKKG